MLFFIIFLMMSFVTTTLCQCKRVQKRQVECFDLPNEMQKHIVASTFLPQKRPPFASPSHSASCELGPSSGAQDVKLLGTPQNLSQNTSALDRSHACFVACLQCVRLSRARGKCDVS